MTHWRQFFIAGVLMLFVSGRCHAQCPTVSRFSGMLYSIENSDATDTEKLQLLQQLYGQYTQCNGARDSLYARIVHRLGNFYRLNNDIQKGISYTNEAISVNKGKGAGTDPAFLVNSYFNLGLCYWQQNLYSRAQYFFDSCITIGMAYPAKYNVVFMAFEKKAFSFFQTGDYQKSTETAEKGIILAMEEKDLLSEAILLCQKAQAQLELNNDSRASEDIQRAISILKNTDGGVNYLATGYSIYARMLIKKNDPSGAVRYYEKSFQLNSSNAEWAQCARDMINLGYLYDTVLHDYSKALNSYNKGIGIIKKTNETAELAGLYINTGLLHWRQKNYPAALQYYQKALNALLIDFPDTSIVSNPGMDMLRLAPNEYYTSTLLANKADALLDEYKAEKNKNLLAAALKTYGVADKAVDVMRWKQSGEQSKLFWRKKTKAMYEHAIEACYLLNDVESAFYFFEKSRAVLLADKLSELGAKRYLPAADRSKEQNLVLAIALINRQLATLQEGTPNYNSIRQKLLTAQEELEKFITALEKKYPFYYKYKYDNAVIALKAVTGHLQRKQALVEYFTGDSSLYILSISAAGNRFEKIALADYASASAEFLQLCADKISLNKNYSRYRVLAYQLYQRLFSKLKIAETRVIISPEESFIPFECLLYSENDPTSFLLKKYAFSYCYSFGLLMKTNNNNAQQENSLLGVAPVHYRPGLNQQPLTGADLSLKKIQSFFPASTLLLNDQATKQAFMENLHRFSAVQIYSHADADSFATEPVLYLCDSAINISDIQNLDDLQARLVVLSACKTGVGKNARGEGVLSLARAFTAAGIPSTITTLWQIDNNATYQLTENFYRHLAAGLPQDVALQQAKLDFLKSNDKTYELPYYWAANILLGETAAMPAPKAGLTFTGKILLITLPVLLLLFLFLLKKRKQKNSAVDF